MAGPIWTIKIDKSWGGRNSEDKWSNVYHVSSPLAADAPEWVGVVDAFAKLERELHLQPVHLTHATVSTIGQDENVYPFNLRVFELSGTGNRAIPAGDNAVDLNICLALKKEVSVGRSGRLLYRGALLASQIQIGTSGKSAWIGPEPTPGTISNAMDLVRNMPETQGIWVLPTRKNETDTPADITMTRRVAAVSVGGVVIARRNHRWFDRAGAPAAPAGA